MLFQKESEAIGCCRFFGTALSINSWSFVLMCSGCLLPSLKLTAILHLKSSAVGIRWLPFVGIRPCFSGAFAVPRREGSNSHCLHALMSVIALFVSYCSAGAVSNKTCVHSGKINMETTPLKKKGIRQDPNQGDEMGDMWRYVVCLFFGS